MIMKTNEPGILLSFSFFVVFSGLFLLFFYFFFYFFTSRRLARVRQRSAKFRVAFHRVNRQTNQSRCSFSRQRDPPNHPFVQRAHTHTHKHRTPFFSLNQFSISSNTYFNFEKIKRDQPRNFPARANSIVISITITEHIEKESLRFRMHMFSHIDFISL